MALEHSFWNAASETVKIFSKILLFILGEFWGLVLVRGMNPGQPDGMDLDKPLPLILTNIVNLNIPLLF